MRNFADRLRFLTRGRSENDLADGLDKLTRAVEETGKPGSLTYKITLKPLKEGPLVATDAITLSIPERSRGETILFPDDEGGWNKQDPRQHEMPLHEVKTETPDTEQQA